MIDVIAIAIQIIFTRTIKDMISPLLTTFYFPTYNF